MVEIDFTAHFSDGAFIDNVAFNLGNNQPGSNPLPNPAPTISSATYISGTPAKNACAGFSYQYAYNNKFSVVGGGSTSGGTVSGFDLGLLFGNHQLANGVTDIIVLSGENLTAAGLDTYLNYDNAPPPTSGWLGHLLTAAKVKNIGSGGSSGEIAGKNPPNDPPAPAPLPLLGGIAAFQASRRLRRLLSGIPD